MDETKQWYVIYTKPRKEQEANHQLLCQGYETCLPLLRHDVRRREHWHEVVDPLFPRYLFIRLQLAQDNIAPIRSTRGVVGLVRFGNSPRPLPSGFVERLGEQARDGVHAHQPVNLAHGDLVQILSGPFAGALARFDLETCEGRVSLLLDLLGRSHCVRMDRNQIAPAV
jgi:transcriptional antiterminator RfaH